MSMTALLAIDLGAESGRVMLGRWQDGRMACELAHRFPNPRRQRDGRWTWDMEALRQGIAAGIALAAARCQGRVAAIGIDTWGVDFAWCDAEGTPLAAPAHHRDPRTAGLAERLAAEHGAEALYRRSGTWPLPFNTVYQVLADLRDRPELVRRAARLLTIPDLLNHWLCGVAANEWTNAGTTGLTCAGQPEWDLPLLDRLGIPRAPFGRIVRPGTVLGPLRSDLAAAWGLAEAPLVVACAAHDTASAVAALPGDGEAAAFISCGTWSLMGALCPGPVTGPEAFAARLSNEIAHDGRIRLLTNIMGLWVLQECRRAMAAAGRERTYAELCTLAELAPDPAAPLPIDDPRFLAPGTAADPMDARVRGWYAERGLAAPADDGALTRAVLDGLARRYAACLTDLRRITGRRLDAIHLIGGGSRNRLLARLSTHHANVPVLCGPDEATALGNLLVVAAGLGLCRLADLPELARASSAVEEVVTQPVR